MAGTEYGQKDLVDLKYLVRVRKKVEICGRVEDARGCRCAGL
jgi:hypothetical protein